MRASEKRVGGSDTTLKMGFVGVLTHSSGAEAVFKDLRVSSSDKHLWVTEAPFHPCWSGVSPLCSLISQKWKLHICRLLCLSLCQRLSFTCGFSPWLPPSSPGPSSLFFLTYNVISLSKPFTLTLAPRCSVIDLNTHVFVLWKETRVPD